MKRTIKTITALLVVYALPLIAAPELILTPQIIILAAACAVILVSQPDFKPSDAKDKQETDKFSSMYIFLAGFASQVIPVIEWGYFGDHSSVIGAPGWTALGAALISGGLAFRLWSIRSLGRFFTSTVQILDGHRLHTSGPYAIVRHPSYLGAFLAIVGSAVLLNAPVGVFASAILMALAYKKRLAAEETALSDAFGSEYQEYCTSTPRIIPLLK